MSARRQDLEALADAMAPLLGLSIEPAAKPRVVDSLVMAAAAAALVMEFPLDESADEPAAIFRAGGQP